MRQGAANRNVQSGMTLVEVLVVLVLVGIMAGVIGLSIGPADRGAGPAQEAQLLVARLNRAAQETAFGGAALGFVWSADAYRFVVLQDGVWVPHPVPLLGQNHELPRDVSLTAADTAQGSYVVSAALLPQDGKALALSFGQNGGAQTGLVFDGISARLVPQVAP